jgi:glutamate-ammonia-ligase adenylyltransferase
MSDAAEKIENLTRDLPDAESAKRFFSELNSKHPTEANKLLREPNRGLLADVLALAAWSPFLATTLLQHPEYIAWLGRKRRERQMRTPEDLLESLARFSLTNSALDTHTLLARFRRRELLRIYLNDIRNLATVAETTEELSNLADACLEHAVRVARQELENRFGVPLETDDKGKAKPAQFSVVALGKLGSRELNYASDIDLLFLYSNDGTTSETGARGSVSNREYFIKLAEKLTNVVGAQSNEGAAYRVDLRLRPHGRVGALAISLNEAARYYKQTARDWERQVLLRSRASAGDSPVFRQFWAEVESVVYRADETVENALTAVRLSKQKINQEQRAETGFNVKLGIGGIREIEFIAQALQLACGGLDAWLRQPHTLIALRRLTDRQFLEEKELAELSDAYAFLRRLEHRLQMEHGLQTHAVPENEEKRRLIACRMGFSVVEFFDESLKIHTENVNRIFERVFRVQNAECAARNKNAELLTPIQIPILQANEEIMAASEVDISQLKMRNYAEKLQEVVIQAANFHDELASLRLEWRRFHDEIHAFDVAEKLSLADSKRLQTELAEAALEAALLIAAKEMNRRFNSSLIAHHSPLNFGVLGLGKLGSRGMDWGSDLDLILIYDDCKQSPVEKLTNAEFYAQAAEVFVNALSSSTREGFLYRVDLRLRPDGKNGALCSGANSFSDYVKTRAAVWEWLAYVKLRAAAGNLELARNVEENARKIVHVRSAEIEPWILKAETKRVRELLEREKTKTLRRGEIDIKHGAGGLLDVYFAVRFLQLRDSVPDENENRSTFFTLKKLRAKDSLDEENFTALVNGYDFLRSADHALRLAAGRATKFPSSSHPLLKQVAQHLKTSENAFLVQLAFHTTEIRSAFNRLLN